MNAQYVLPIVPSVHKEAGREIRMVNSYQCLGFPVVGPDLRITFFVMHQYHSHRDRDRGSSRPLPGNLMFKKYTVLLL